MSRRLVVIIGAGASHDCTSDPAKRRKDRRPPLVKDLFGKNFDYLMGRYPLAQAAADEIRQAIDPESKDALPLEDYLREQMRDSTDSYTRLRYRQIPLYLQDLLFAVGNLTGEGYTSDPDNYNALNNAVLKLDDVLFLTLNYDTLLDDRLFNYRKLETLDSYVTSDSSFALVKLHGSVNWGRRMVGTLERGTSASREDINWFINDAPELEFETGEIELRLQSGITDKRYEAAERAVFYPALSIPLGPADELVCPPSHRAAAQQRLAEAESLNLLVIGYSGNDRAVLELLRESGRTIRRLLVANGSWERGYETAERLQSTCGRGDVLEDAVFEGGFTQLVRSDPFRGFLSGI
jgi:hypothetical protein